MKYGNIVKAEFISRPNRFVARVLLDGQQVTAHVKNTGRCKELLVPGAAVYLEDFTGRMGTRKLPYSLIAVEKGKLLINMDSQVPNRVTQEALTDGTILLPHMDKPLIIRPETVYGNSRFDFFIQDIKGKQAFAEVKGVTLENDGIASFPDAPTQRGIKHLQELIAAAYSGYNSYIIFIIQMSGIKYFTPNYERHKEFGDVLRQAAEKGVNLLAYECAVTPDTLRITSPIPIML